MLNILQKNSKNTTNLPQERLKNYRKISKSFNPAKWRIRNQITWIIIMIIVFVSLIIAYVSYITLEEYHKKSVEKSIESVLETNMDIMDIRLNQFHDLVNSILFNEDMAIMMETNEYLNRSSLEITQEMDKKYIPLFFVSKIKYLKDFILFGYNGVNASWSLRQSIRYEQINDIEKIDIFKTAKRAAGAPVWFFSENTQDLIKSSNANNSIYYTRYMFTYNSVINRDYVKWGYLYIELDEKILWDGKTFAEFISALDGKTLLLDDDGNIIYNSANHLEKDEIEVLQSFLKGTHKSRTQKYTSYTVYASHSNLTGWKIVNIVPNAYQGKTVLKIMDRVTIVVLVMIFFAILLSIILSISITKPLYALVKRIDTIGYNNLKHINDIEGNQDVEVLIGSYNKMIDRINDLIRKNTEDETLIRELELKALRAQINPHFLYNTLDAIYWMCVTKRYENISEMILALSTFFRLALNKGSELTTVEKEIEHAKNYMLIQKIRFARLFEFKIEVSEEIKNKKCPTMILQPLVENCILHGFSEIKTGGQIEIVGCLGLNDTINIYVKDNGKGAKSLYLNNKIRENRKNEGENYGVSNVHNRIRLYFGEEYGISYLENIDSGTTVLIKLPAQ